MTNRDEIKNSVDNMVTGWFNGEGHDVDKDDIFNLVMKHCEGAAEPFGWIKPGAATNDERYDYGMFAYRKQEDTPVPIYTAALSVDAYALADAINKLEVAYSVAECVGLADWAAFEAGITKGLQAAAEKVSNFPTQAQDVAAISQLNAVVDAWEALAGGRQVRNSEVEKWLADDMAPAINSIRAFLKRPRPDGVIPAAPAKPAS